MPPTFPTPSTGALKVLRRLAFAGSAVTAIGGVCGVAAATYERHQRIRLAEKILEQKRKIHACSRYRGSAETLAVMMEMAEMGTFDGKDSLPRRKGKAWGVGEVEVKKEREAHIATKLDSASTALWPPKALDRLWGPERLDNAKRNDPLDTPIAKFDCLQDVSEISPEDSKSLTAKVAVISGVWRPSVQMSLNVPPSSTRSLPALDHGPSFDFTDNGFHTFEQTFRHRIEARLQNHVSTLAFSKHGQNTAETWHKADPVEFQLKQADDDSIAERFLQNDFSGALREYLAHGRASDIRISSYMRYGLFIAALKEMDRKSAAVIFQQAQEQSEHADSLHDIYYNELIAAHVIARDHEGMANIFLRYSDSLQLLPALHAQVIRALLNTKRFNEAEALMEGTLRLDDDLDRLQGISAAFVSKLWVNSRKLDLVKSQFEKLLAWKGGALVSSKLYNSIIQACVESNKDVQARRYYEDMKSKHGLLQDIRTGLLLLEIDASEGNWQLVEKGLRELHEDGATLADRLLFTKSFTRMMGIYAKDHIAVEVQRFLYDAIKSYGMIPDQFLSNEYVTKCVHGGRLDLIADWFGLASEKDWNLVFNGKTFAMAFQAYWMSTRVSFEHLSVLLQTCVNLLGNEGLGHRGHRLLSHDVIDTLREAIMYHRRKSHDAETRWRFWDKLGAIERNYTDANAMVWKDWRRDPDQLRKKMLYERSRGNDREAVELFKEARAAGGLIKRNHLQMAVQASIRSTGSTDEASRLFREAAGVEESVIVAGEIFYHNMESWYPSQGYKPLLAAVEAHYIILERQGLPVDFRIVAAAALRLLELGLHHLAIEMLMWMHGSKWCKRKPLDMSCMTILLRAYYLNKNNAGAEWVITQVLARNMPIDAEFYYQVWAARKNLVWKQMTEGQICGTEDVPEGLRKWSLAMDIWVRDVKMREKQVSYEKYARGYDLIKLAGDFGGLGPKALKGREAERLLNQATGELDIRITAYQQGSRDPLWEEVISKEESWMRKVGWMPCKVKIHYVPRPRAPRPRLRHIDYQSSRARRRARFALRALHIPKPEVSRPELGLVKAQWKVGKPWVVLNYTSRLIRHIA